MIFLILKLIHILSAIILFGVGLGTVFYKIMADRSGDLAAIAVTSRHVVQADWWFTTPTVIIQPLTGLLLARELSLPLTAGWLWQTLALYLLAGLCWIPVVYLQIRLRDIAADSWQHKQPLPFSYHRYSLIWLALGVPAFFAMLLITALMVFHGSFWS